MMKYFKILGLLIIGLISLSPLTAQDTSKREIYIQSNGYNAGIGHVVIKIIDQTVFIDTSFYPINFNVEYIDPIWIGKNKIFHSDITNSITYKQIYYSLATLHLDTLKYYADKSQKTMEFGRPETIILKENDKVDTLNFHLPEIKSKPMTNYEWFLLDLRNLFPFGSDNFFYCKQFYKSDKNMIDGKARMVHIDSIYIDSNKINSSGGQPYKEFHVQDTVILSGKYFGKDIVFDPFDLSYTTHDTLNVFKTSISKILINGQFQKFTIKHEEINCVPFSIQLDKFGFKNGDNVEIVIICNEKHKFIIKPPKGIKMKQK